MKLRTLFQKCGLVFREDHSLGLRSRGTNGWQAKAPAPQKRKPMRAKVGQTLSSVNPAISAIFSQLLSVAPNGAGPSGRPVGKRSGFTCPNFRNGVSRRGARTHATLWRVPCRNSSQQRGTVPSGASLAAETECVARRREPAESRLQPGLAAPQGPIE
jgi:hypothetical protein